MHDMHDVAIILHHMILLLLYLWEGWNKRKIVKNNCLQNRLIDRCHTQMIPRAGSTSLLKRHLTW